MFLIVHNVKISLFFESKSFGKFVWEQRMLHSGHRRWWCFLDEEMRPLSLQVWTAVAAEAPRPLVIFCCISICHGPHLHPGWFQLQTKPLFNFSTIMSKLWAESNPWFQFYLHPLPGNSMNLFFAFSKYLCEALYTPGSFLMAFIAFHRQIEAPQVGLVGTVFNSWHLLRSQ